jgi:hypothetical protein
MSDHDTGPARHGRRDASIAARSGATDRYESNSRAHIGPDGGQLTKNSNKPTITLRDGVVLDAREAAAVRDALQRTLSFHPDEFQSLLALADGRVADVEPGHMGELRAHAFLKRDDSLDPVVRAVLMNCYEVTRDGPVFVPLRLRSSADLEAATWAEAQIDEFYRNLLPRRPNQDRPR